MAEQDAQPKNEAGGRPEDEAQSISGRLLTGLLKLSLALKGEAYRGASSRGLSPTQAETLALLQRRGALETRLGDVARELALTPATVSDAVSTLVGKGLVGKSEALSDRRAVALSLTPKGHRAARQAASWPDFLLPSLQDLPGEDQEALLRILLRLLSRLQAEGRIPMTRMCISCRFFQPDVHEDPLRPHHCAFMDIAFGDPDLRTDCPDHRSRETV